MTVAAVAFGGNRGEVERAFQRAFGELSRTAAVRGISGSRLYRSAPFGFTDQREFLNAVARVETSLSAPGLLELLQRLELREGERDGPRWGPRALDLDLLLFGQAVAEEPGLTLPHPGIPERTFVLCGLEDVLPEWRHPLLGSRPADMHRALRASGRATRCVPIEGAVLGHRAALSPR